ncbi:ankyrin repeat domain-containing protein [Rhodopirellula baltica]|uniref:ankyrin repeat domain-containing protein n=1 Tax=Rhodopirellula baltica TaxID=265606 RepID=UPI001F1E403B|nr:ankyrin repeat domain-containing protein [Rhodopirellula baltica]
MALLFAMLRDFELLAGIKRGHLSDFNQAVERGATYEAKDLDGRSASEVAVRSGQPEILRNLILAGANANGAVGKRGDQLIHLAAKIGDIGCLTVLLENGAHVDARGHYRRTPLHAVSKSGGGYMANLLFEHQANPDASDVRGNTPLHIASERGDLPMVKLMVKHHASALITNNQLYTPVHTTAANGHTEVANWLLDNESAVNSCQFDPAFVERIKKVAERHGHKETAGALAERSSSGRGHSLLDEPRSKANSSCDSFGLMPDI